MADAGVDYCLYHRCTKVLIHQDPSQTAKVHQPWHDKPFALGDFIQVSATSLHKGKEWFVVAIKMDGDNVIYYFHPTYRLSGQPPSFFSDDMPTDGSIVDDSDHAC